MLSATALCLLRPRYVKFKPPALSQRAADFRCKNCNFWWQSQHAWVTMTTERTYQGQTCERCGEISKPYHVYATTPDKQWAHLPQTQARPRRGQKPFIPFGKYNRSRG
jgi:hypothetical protein